MSGTPNNVVNLPFTPSMPTRPMRDIDYDMAQLFGLDSKDMRKLMGAMSKLFELIDEKPQLVKRFLKEEFPEVEKAAGRLMDFLVRAYMDQVQREKAEEARLEAEKKRLELAAKKMNRARRAIKKPAPVNPVVVGVDPMTGNIIGVDENLKPFDLGNPSERSIIGLGSPIEASELSNGISRANNPNWKEEAQSK